MIGYNKYCTLQEQYSSLCLNQLPTEEVLYNDFLYNIEPVTLDDAVATLLQLNAAVLFKVGWHLLLFLLPSFSGLRWKLFLYQVKGHFVCFRNQVYLRAFGNFWNLMSVCKPALSEEKGGFWNLVFSLNNAQFYCTYVGSSLFVEATAKVMLVSLCN